MKKSGDAFLTDRNRLWAKRSAVHYLGSYSSSVENLRKTLVRRACNRFEDIEEAEASALADEAVRFCVENGFVDDVAYAETKVAAGMRKGHSRRKIAAALAGKGVDKEIARTAAGEADDETAAVAYARKRRLGPWRKKEDDPAQRRREAASLGRNGFSGETAFKVIGMELEEAEDILSGRSRADQSTA